MPTEQAGSAMGASPLIPYLLIFLIFYFLIIKPQRDKQKEHKETLKNLKKNDSIITAGGMHGKISLVKEKTVVIRIDDNVKVEFDKESIATVVKQ